MNRLATSVVLFLFVGCGGPSGSITGKVVVEGGSAGNVPVAIYGPVSQVALSKEDGAFTATGLPDGQYLARAVIRGAFPEEVSVPVKVAGGKADSEPVLSFKAKPSGTRKISGRVTVMGGSAANITVFVDGPQSSVAVTAMDGTFTTPELPDGEYALRAVVRGAEVEEVTAQVKLVDGKQDAEPMLTFRVPMKGTVTGKVAFTDGSDASNLLVTLGGTVFLGARTDAMGTFTFMNVPSGTAILSVDVPDTKELRLSQAVVVDQPTVDAGTLRFTPVARVSGVVSAAGMPVAQAIVSVGGTGFSATTNAAGRFTLEGLPVGDTSFLARTTAPIRSGTAMQRLVRGANTDVMITVAIDPAATGTVIGAVTFSGPQSPRIITVSIPAAGITAQVGSNGAFSLANVPVGEWEVFATAPLHPRQSIGRVAVASQGTSTLPAATLSFYERVWSANSLLSSFGTVGVSSPWVVGLTSEPTQQRAVLINARTKDVRVLTNGPIALVRFSATNRYLAFVTPGAVMTYELTTGQLRSWGTDASATNLAISTDESTLFVQRGPVLERHSFATGQMTRFPAMGSAVSIQQHTVDRWLVREGTEVSLVEPAMVTPSLFTNVTLFAASPTPWALTNCVGIPSTCSLRVVGPTGRAANLVTGSWPGTTSLSSNPEYPLLSSTSGVYVVRSSDGALFPLPTGLSAVSYNSTNSRIAHVAGGALREEALPPSPTTMPVATTPGTFDVRYFSPTRLVAIDQGPVRRIIDVRSGTATIDTDVAPSGGTFGLSGTPVAMWPAPSTSTWKAFVGDRVQPFDTGISTTTSPATPLARPGTPVTEIGAISADTTTSVVLDGRTGMARRLLIGRIVPVGSATERVGTIELFPLARSGPAAVIAIDTAADIVLETQEPRYGTNFTGLQGIWLGLDEDRRGLVLGTVLR